MPPRHLHNVSKINMETHFLIFSQNHLLFFIQLDQLIVRWKNWQNIKKVNLILTLILLLVFFRLRRACGYQNLVRTSVYGRHNLPQPVGIGLRWLPKRGVDKSLRPHAWVVMKNISEIVFWIRIYKVFEPIVVCSTFLFLVPRSKKSHNYLVT